MIDSQNEIILTYKKVFETILPEKPANFDEVDFGGTMPQTLEKLYGNNIELKNKAKQLFIDLYDNSSFTNTPLFEGIIETLSELTTKAYTLHIATNKRLNPTLKILKKKAISHFFTDIKTSDTYGNRLMSKTEMVREICNNHKLLSGCMVGDSLQDIEAGQNNQIKTIAVSYGYGDMNTIKNQKPDYIINSFSELLNLPL